LTPAERASNEVALGMLRIDQGELPKAEELLRATLDSAKRNLPPNHPEIVKATTALGRVLMERGDYKQAATVLEEAVRVLNAGRPDTLLLADILRQLADTRFYSGDYAASDSINRLLMPIHKHLYGDQHPLVAEDLIDLGATEQQRGNYVTAEKYH